MLVSAIVFLLLSVNVVLWPCVIYTKWHGLVCAIVFLTLSVKGWSVSLCDIH